MAGAPDWQQLTATLPSKSESVLTFAMPDIAAGGFADVIVYSPAATLSTIMSAYANIAQSGATAGTIGGYWYFPEAQGSITYATLDYSDGPLEFDNAFWSGADGGQTGLTSFPADASYWLGKNVTFGSTHGLGWQTSNNLTGGTISSAQQTVVVKITVEDLP